MLLNLYFRPIQVKIIQLRYDFGFLQSGTVLIRRQVQGGSIIVTFSHYMRCKPKVEAKLDRLIILCRTRLTLQRFYKWIHTYLANVTKLSHFELEKTQRELVRLWTTEIIIEQAANTDFVTAPEYYATSALKDNQPQNIFNVDPLSSRPRSSSNFRSRSAESSPLSS